MKKLLSKSEVAELLGLSISTINNWVTEKRNIPFRKLGSRVLFDLQDVEEYLDKVRVDPIKEDING